jgi:hypothetical protein
MRQFDSSHAYKSVFLADAVAYARASASIGQLPDDASDGEGNDAIGADDGDEPPADLARDSAGALRFVSQKLDYAYRDPLLSGWSFCEFGITFYKAPNDPRERCGDDEDDCAAQEGLRARLPEPNVFQAFLVGSCVPATRSTLRITYAREPGFYSPSSQESISQSRRATRLMSKMPSGSLRRTPGLRSS